MKETKNLVTKKENPMRFKYPKGSKRLTVGELRKFIDNMPDSSPLTIDGWVNEPVEGQKGPYGTYTYEVNCLVGGDDFLVFNFDLDEF